MFRFISYYLSKRVYCTVFVAFVIFYAINTKHEILMDSNFIEIFRTDKGFKIGMSLKSNIEGITKHSDVAKPNKSFSQRIHDMKYILVWTNPRNTPLVYLGDGQTVFLNKSCAWSNCHVTSDRNLLGDYTEFEAVLFNGPELYHIRYMNDLPKRRYQHQKYIYASIEAAANYPICSEFWNNFFNWTWSYKTDSDLYWPYFSIRDSMKKIIGPKKDMNWIEKRDMNMIDTELKVSLSSKTKAAAWFASNCETQSLREHYVEELREKMKLFGLELDIFGECGSVLQCPRNIMSRCHRMLEKQYYFYLAFENSISDDYVSEKILHALLHNTVPVVLGGANYSWFLPKGSYLNALELGAMKLARKMYELIQNPKAYNDYFRWKKYYSYHYTHESSETDEYCRLCEYLNNNKLVNKQSVYEHFNHWWTPRRYCSNVISVSLSKKTKAAAWFASNCETQSLRKHYVEELREKMKLFGLELDIFGECGSVLQCPRNIMSRCHRMLEKQNYFYLAFENSISDDYVSEKILHALLHNTVPVVLGGANYSWFLPKGSYYLNALELGAMKLARKMYELIQNPKAYNDYFRWKKYYSYHYTHESSETDEYCRLCEYLNNNKLVNKQSVYEHFNHWWTPRR